MVPAFNSLFAQLLAVLAFGILTTACTVAEPYSWPLDAPESVVAPTDRAQQKLTGAALQGGLVDLRYGQACIELRGSGVILEWDDSSLFSLNGISCTAKQLAELVTQGKPLTVAVRYDPKSGLIGWLDAFGAAEVPAIRVGLIPSEAKQQVANSSLIVTIPDAESQRLQLKEPYLFIPGITHSLNMQQKNKGWVGNLPLMQDWEWREIPIFVVSEPTKVFKSTEISISLSRPQVFDFGPQTASGHLKQIPCWIDLEGPIDLLDFHNISVMSSKGSRVSDIQLRNGRLSFYLQVIGPGTYQVEARIGDTRDRDASIDWSIFVQP